MASSDRANAAVSSKAMSAEKLLFELQVEQYRHDEVYHREIARLSLHHRLNHMALHFAKYTGRISEHAGERPNLQVFVDTLVIALSTANILNVKLWDVVEPDRREFLDLMAFGRSLAHGMSSEMGTDAILREMASATGRMAAACEKIDHLEEINFRAEITHSVGRLSTISLAVIASCAVDPAQAVRARLNDVKQRLKLHGRV